MSADRLTLAVAGHVDHGKTALTGALTGVDTDRFSPTVEAQQSSGLELLYSGRLIQLKNNLGLPFCLRQLS